MWRKLLIAPFIVSTIFTQPFDFETKVVRENISFEHQGKQKTLVKDTRIIEPDEWIKFQKQTLELLRQLDQLKLRIVILESKEQVYKTERELLAKFDEQQKEWMMRERELMNELVGIYKDSERQLRKRNRNLNRQIFIERLLGTALIAASVIR